MTRSVARLVLVLALAPLVTIGAQTPRPGAPALPTGPSRTDFTMALTGDSIVTRHVNVYAEPAWLKLLSLLRDADVAFTNLEMLFHDYEPYPMPQSVPGTYVRAEPAIAKDLTWMGFDMVARANNHAADFGVLGMQLTTKYVGEAGLVQAGAGDSLAEAREAKFLDTPRGRVALVSACTLFDDYGRAGDTRGDIPPRPGVNALRFTTTYVVTRERLDGLRATLAELGLAPPASAQSDQLRVFGNRFVAGDAPQVKTEPLKEDLDAIAAVVRNASRLADYTLVTFHGHEQGRSRFEPPAFWMTFAHVMIDAGADLVVGHGPHVLRGIEIYKGKPILYSVGNLFFQNETELRLPSDAYETFKLGPTSHVADFNDQRYDFDRRGFPAQREIWESVVAIPRWQGRQLMELTLYPITLGFGRPRMERGRPMLAPADLGKKIIDDVIRLSAPYHTEIAWDGAVGRVNLVAGSTK
jgi:poly-gamma-glutamate synthesis protein (capsule biosynthesis protein)